MVGGPLGGSVGGLVGPCRGGSGFESFGSSLRVLDLSMCGPEEMQIEGTLPLDIGDQCPLLEQVRRDEEAKRRRGEEAKRRRDEDMRRPSYSRYVLFDVPTTRCVMCR